MVALLQTALGGVYGPHNPYSMAHRYALVGVQRRSGRPPPARPTGKRAPVLAMIKEELKDLKEDIKEDIKEFVKKDMSCFSGGERSLTATAIKERLWLEELEHRIADLYKKSRILQTHAISRCFLGAVVLLSGAEYSRCVVMAHTFRVTGWPRLNSCFMELGKYYTKARDTVRQEVGHIRSPSEILHAVQYQLKALRQVVKESQKAKEDGKITEEEAKEVIRKANIDIHRLNREAWVLNQAVSSMAAISAAIDVPKMRDLLLSTYTGLMACVASANNLTLRKISVGFDLGNIVGSDLSCLAWSAIESSGSDVLAKALPQETRKLIAMAVGLIGTAKGMLLVHTIIPKMSLQISAAALGARWITDAVTDVADPYLEKAGRKPLKDRAGYAFIHVALTLGGIAFQYYGKSLPRNFDTILRPLKMLEHQLRGLEG